MTSIDAMLYREAKIRDTRTTTAWTSQRSKHAQREPIPIRSCSRSRNSQTTCGAVSPGLGSVGR